jgi:EamA-like transporter family protein
VDGARRRGQPPRTRDRPGPGGRHRARFRRPAADLPPWSGGPQAPRRPARLSGLAWPPRPASPTCTRPGTWHPGPVAARARGGPARRLDALARTHPRNYPGDDLNVTWSITGALVALGPIGTGLAYVINYDVVTRDGATAASVVTYLLPIVSIAVGAAIVDEIINLAAAAGTVVVLASVALARRRATGEPDGSPSGRTAKARS